MKPLTLSAQGSATSLTTLNEGVELERARGPVCLMCGKPLHDTWRRAGGLCWECGLNDELFHPETRWVLAEQEFPKKSTASSRSRPQFDLLVVIALVVVYTVFAGVGLATLSNSQRVVETVLQNSRN